MTEIEIQEQIKDSFSLLPDLSLWRANIGTHGFHVSLPKGFPDLFGYRSLIITPNLLGKTFAQFAFIEVKSPNGKLSKEQKEIHQLLIDSGAIGGVAHSHHEAIKLLRGD